MKRIIHIFLIMILQTSSEELEYNELQEVIQEINEIIDVSLTNTQLTVHSVSKHILSSFNKDVLYTTDNRNISSDSVELFIKLNTLLDCREWKLVQKQSVPVDIPLNRWMKNLKVNLVVLENEILIINNSIDRLVMNGSRNFTEKCEFSSNEDEFFDCLQSAIDKVYDLCDDLVDRLSRTLSYFRTVMCLSLDFINPIDK
ncbi:uncharacterized protein LOC128994338 [Macrosteles quadrilineatus]|uniref:uncharacterized protein LOC128994338 n=1 Tax=Macrosteles quadrilineatus TaxID=74068 RepID=UPI0023E28B3F|nr:uncharacterized protein LOC128994338 [Macrosteles quadrilineatus]